MIGCTTCSESRTITVVLSETHPWEQNVGRRFWYTLIYNLPTGLETVTLSIGVREITLLIPKGQTTICTAYPLGTGIPMGGAHCSYDSHDTLFLSSLEGPLALHLLHLYVRWPQVISVVQFDTLCSYLLQVDPRGRAIDWQYLAKDIINGVAGASSIRKKEEIRVSLDGIPAGYWVCEYPWYPDLFVYSSMPTMYEDLSPGILRFINKEYRLELKIIVSDDDNHELFFHMVPIDPLITLSEAAYQHLLEGSQHFP